ncbi:MAG TPA: P-loop NTPase, partial [Spirochaetia bacterium]|nr:P-loop NTPase [Spirochaetia bacterium]
MQILPIASGKGGVGKSLVAANLSIALSEAGKKVILADMDLGASNLHLMLGFNSVRKGIGTYLNNTGIDFSEIILETDYPNLRFIPGDAEIPGLSNIKVQTKNALIKRLLALDADYLIMDLGAGSGLNTMDFFLTSGTGIVVTAPTLTATLNAYIFLKNAVFRILSSSFRKDSFAWDYLESLRKDGMSLQKIYIPAFLEHIRFKDHESYDTYKLRMANFKPKLIANLLDDPRDAEKASRIRRSCKEYLDVEVEHLGVIYRDHLQDIALSARLPIVKYKP